MALHKVVESIDRHQAATDLLFYGASGYGDLKFSGM
jgi:hypothetical protein